MTIDHKNPVLRVVPGPSDINANGHIFGGWVLSQMDRREELHPVDRHGRDGALGPA